MNGEPVTELLEQGFNLRFNRAVRSLNDIHEQVPVFAHIVDQQAHDIRRAHIGPVRVVEPVAQAGVGLPRFLFDIVQGTPLAILNDSAVDVFPVAGQAGLDVINRLKFAAVLFEVGVIEMSQQTASHFAKRDCAIGIKQIGMVAVH